MRHNAIATFLGSALLKMNFIFKMLGVMLTLHHGRRGFLHAIRSPGLFACLFPPLCCRSESMISLPSLEKWCGRPRRYFTGILSVSA